jgi:hypothetical protein
MFAFIATTDTAGHEVILRAEDIVSALEIAGGGTLATTGTGTYQLNETAAAIHSAIDTKWTQYLTGSG